MLLDMPDRQVFIIAATDGSSIKRWQRTSITGEISDGVDAHVREKGRITVRELFGILNISDVSVKTITKQHLQYSKLCDRLIPRLSMDEHKSTRL